MFRWTGDRWERLGPDLPARAEFGSRQLEVDSHPCVVVRRARSSVVRCATARGWRRVGQPIAVNSAEQGTLFVTTAVNGPVPMLLANGIPRPTVAKGGASLTGRSVTRLYELRAHRWRAVELPREFRTDGQRPDIAGGPGKLCLAQTLGSGSVTVSCRRHGRWSRMPTVPATPGTRRSDVDGLAVHRRRPCVGVDEFAHPAVRWKVHCLHRGRWRPTSLSPSSAWNQQGELVRRGDWLFALRFEQLPGPAGLEARASLRGAGADWRSVPIGPAVLPRTTLQGPVGFDVETAQGQLFVLSARSAAVLDRPVPFLLSQQVPEPPTGAP